jgi:hypothetical protein
LVTPFYRRYIKLNKPGQSYIAQRVCAGIMGLGLRSGAVVFVGRDTLEAGNAVFEGHLHTSKLFETAVQIKRAHAFQSSLFKDAALLNREEYFMPDRGVLCYFVVTDEEAPRFLDREVEMDVYGIRVTLLSDFLNLGINNPGAASIAIFSPRVSDMVASGEIAKDLIQLLEFVSETNVAENRLAAIQALQGGPPLTKDIAKAITVLIEGMTGGREVILAGLERESFGKPSTPLIIPTAVRFLHSCASVKRCFMLMDEPMKIIRPSEGFKPLVGMKIPVQLSSTLGSYPRKWSNPSEPAPERIVPDLDTVYPGLHIFRAVYLHFMPHPSIEGKIEGHDMRCYPQNISFTLRGILDQDRGHFIHIPSRRYTGDLGNPILASDDDSKRFVAPREYLLGIKQEVAPLVGEDQTYLMFRALEKAREIAWRIDQMQSIMRRNAGEEEDDKWVVAQPSKFAVKKATKKDDKKMEQAPKGGTGAQAGPGDAVDKLEYASEQYVYIKENALSDMLTKFISDGDECLQEAIGIFVKHQNNMPFAVIESFNRIIFGCVSAADRFRLDESFEKSEERPVPLLSYNVGGETYLFPSFSVNIFASLLEGSKRVDDPSPPDLVYACQIARNYPEEDGGIDFTGVCQQGIAVKQTVDLRDQIMGFIVRGYLRIDTEARTRSRTFVISRWSEEEGQMDQEISHEIMFTKSAFLAVYAALSNKDFFANGREAIRGNLICYLHAVHQAALELKETASAQLGNIIALGNKIDDLSQPIKKAILSGQTTNGNFSLYSDLLRSARVHLARTLGTGKAPVKAKAKKITAIKPAEQQQQQDASAEPAAAAEGSAQPTATEPAPIVPVPTPAAPQPAPVPVTPEPPAASLTVNYDIGGDEF